MANAIRSIATPKISHTAYMSFSGESMLNLNTSIKATIAKATMIEPRNRIIVLWTV